jgi:hypothetical protein
MHYFTENSRQLIRGSQVGESNKTMEDIYNFLETVKPKNTRDRTKTLVRAKQPLDPIPESLEKQKNKKAEGLNDNILNDFENKDKARKGLLFLLNKLSNGTFCPEINDYFRELRENQIKENISAAKKDSSKKDVAGKNLRRQNFLEKLTETKKENIDIQSNEDEIFKVNFRNANKDKPVFTVLNAINTKHITFKKRKKKNEFMAEKKQDDNKALKTYKDDFNEKELNLFYSDKEIEKSKKNQIELINSPPKNKITQKNTHVSKKTNKNSKSVVFLNDMRSTFNDRNITKKGKGGVSTLNEKKVTLGKFFTSHGNISPKKTTVRFSDPNENEIKEEGSSTPSD